jgi:peptidase A4-like protein
VGAHWTFVLRARNAGGKTAVVRRALVLQAPPFDITSNWAGYVVPSTTLVTEAAGEFTVPSLNCGHTPDASEATWVGIGGNGGSSGDLLQTGVESDCVGDVQVENPGWWEEFPEYYSVTFNSMSVSQGDQIEASVFQATDGSWVTRLDDLTTGISGLMETGHAWGTVLDSAPTTWLVQEGNASSVSYTGGYTAEWIVEDYGRSDGSLVPFADFGTLAFNNMTTSLTSWSLTPDEEVGLGDRNGNLLAAPSAPDSSGGFSVSYTG